MFKVHFFSFFRKKQLSAYGDKPCLITCFPPLSRLPFDKPKPRARRGELVEGHIFSRGIMSRRLVGAKP
jgi:hypothetical protein